MRIDEEGASGQQRWSQESIVSAHKLIDSLSAHIAVLDAGGTICETNASWEAFAVQNGYAGRPFVAGRMNYFEVCRASAAQGDAIAAATLDGLLRVLDGRDREFSIEYPCHSPHERRWFLLRATGYGEKRRGIIVAHETITDRHLATERLRETLQERDILLKEIHHRVKNNLQIISSLLSLQAKNQTDPAFLELLEGSRNRIRSIALVHEALYRSDDFAAVDFATYARGLARQLLDSLGPRNGSIELHLDIAPVRIGINHAVPCGLLLNELISNALKHAFPEGGRGTITVSIQPCGDERYRLRVQDDGVGLPEQSDVSGRHTLGMQLIEALATQLGGKVTFEVGRGTSAELEFET